MHLKVLLIFFLFSSFLFISCSSEFKVINKPISFSEERISLTKQYIEERYGLDVYHPYMQEPKIIVLHWTASDNFNGSFSTFNQEKLESSRPDLAAAGQVNIAIQFLVDMNGDVYQLMPETKVARHVIGLNYSAIGVENVGGGKGIDNLTDDQIESNIQIVRLLKNKFPSVEYLIGHHEYREFEGHQLWLEKDNTYRTKKSDPGNRFMTAVREAVKDLQLKGVDEIRKEKLLIHK